jgi:membrane-associated protein
LIDHFYIHFDINGIKLGIYIVLFIVLPKLVFCRFLLPGDSLLFFAGIYNRDLIENILFIENDFINVALLATFVALSGILGNVVGYWFGSKVAIICTTSKIVLVQKKIFSSVQRFFEKYGGKSLIFARFLQYFEHLRL